MKITRSQLKEIIREELGLIKETTIKTKSGHKIELSAAGSTLKISNHRDWESQSKACQYKCEIYRCLEESQTGGVVFKLTQTIINAKRYWINMKHRNKKRNQ